MFGKPLVNNVLVASVFSIRVVGEPEDMLGVEISRDRAARTLSICQARKALQLAVDFGVEGERRATPMPPAAYGELRAARGGDELADKARFLSGVASLPHLAQCTRPDVAVAVGALASFSSAPTAAHYDTMLDVVRYVGATATRGITYGLLATPCEFWCDAIFAACKEHGWRCRGVRRRRRQAENDGGVNDGGGVPGVRRGSARGTVAAQVVWGQIA